jgi:hypothetical protein
VLFVGFLRMAQRAVGCRLAIDLEVTSAYCYPPFRQIDCPYADSVLLDSIPIVVTATVDSVAGSR